MEKPEKKSQEQVNMGSDSRMKRHEWYFNSGYNQAVDDYEKFLPSEEEILAIVKKEVHRQFMKSSVKNVWLEQGDLTKVLSKRLR